MERAAVGDTAAEAELDRLVEPKAQAGVRLEHAEGMVAAARRLVAKAEDDLAAAGDPVVAAEGRELAGRLREWAARCEPVIEQLRLLAEEGQPLGLSWYHFNADKLERNRSANDLRAHLAGAVAAALNPFLPGHQQIAISDVNVRAHVVGLAKVITDLTRSDDLERVAEFARLTRAARARGRQWHPPVQPTEEDLQLAAELDAEDAGAAA
jgi:hypothetical protein